MFFTDTLGFEDMYKIVNSDIHSKPTVISAEDIFDFPRLVVAHWSERTMEKCANNSNVAHLPYFWCSRSS